MISYAMLTMKTLKPQFTLSATPSKSSSSSSSSSSRLISNSTPNIMRYYPLFYRIYNCIYHNSHNPVTSSSSPSSSSSSSKVSPTHYANSSSSSSSSSLMVSEVGPTSTASQDPYWNSHPMEEILEKVIFRCRFVTFLGVFGSLIGSLLCFLKGSCTVVSSFVEHYARSGKEMVLLVEAIDSYLLGTVMLVFGMGLYELFVSNLDIAKSQSNIKMQQRSNLFGLFTMIQRPRWLEIESVDELKTKVGHVIVLLLLIGLFDNCKKVAVNTPSDLLCFAASIFLCSGCLYMLSKLNDSN